MKNSGILAVSLPTSRTGCTAPRELYWVPPSLSICGMRVRCYLLVLLDVLGVQVRVLAFKLV